MRRGAAWSKEAEEEEEEEGEEKKGDEEREGKLGCVILIEGIVGGVRRARFWAYGIANLEESATEGLKGKVKVGKRAELGYIG